MKYLMLSVSRRGELKKDFRTFMQDGSTVIPTDNSSYAPTLYFADKKNEVQIGNDEEGIVMTDDVRQRSD